MKLNHLPTSNLLFAYDRQAKLEALNRAYGIVEFDLQGNIAMVNDLFCSMVGYSEDELTGSPHINLLSKTDRAWHRRFWTDVLAGRLQSGQFKRIAKDGSQVWIQASYTPIIDSNGQLLGVIKLAQDITNSRNEQAALQSRLAALNRAQAVIEFGLDGVILNANSNYCELSGYSLSELVGLPHRRLCPPEFANSPEYQRFWDTLRRGEFVSGRFRRFGKNGTPFWIQASYNPILDGDGNVRKVIKYAYDITQNVELEMTANQQRAIMDLMLTAHHSFLLDRDLASACDKIFTPLLAMLECELGFMGMVRQDKNQSILHIPCITNLAWDKKTHRWYEQQRKRLGGLNFHRLDNLFGQVITQDQTVCHNHPDNDENNWGPLTGHLHIDSFLGIPIRHQNTVIGMIGLANRSDGFDDTVAQLLAPLITTLGTLIHARSLEDERTHIENTLRFHAEHDFLTGLPNRNSFFAHANVLFEHMEDEGSTLPSSCLALLDIDHFKQINDEYGHLTGDAVLKELSSLLMGQFRHMDIIARIGGEEFIVLLQGAARDLSIKIMDRCRKQIAKHSFQHEGQTIRFTISVGISAFSSQFHSIDEWIQDADTRLYTAKHTGRNRVV